MKLKKVNEDNTPKKTSRDYNIYTKVIDKDPDTGAVTWNVEYERFNALNRKLKDLVDAFDSAIKKYPEDEVLQKYLDIFKELKKRLLTYITKHYK